MEVVAKRLDVRERDEKRVIEIGWQERPDRSIELEDRPAELAAQPSKAMESGKEWIHRPCERGVIERARRVRKGNGHDLSWIHVIGPQEIEELLIGQSSLFQERVDARDDGCACWTPRRRGGCASRH